MRRSSRAAANPLWGGFIVLMVVATLLPLWTPWPALALLPGVALGALVLLGRAPSWGLYAIVFLIPFGNFRQLGGPLADVKIHWVLALVLLVVLALRLLREQQAVGLLRSNLWPWWGLFLAVSLFSTLWSAYPLEAGQQVVLTLVAMAFFALVLVFLDAHALVRQLPVVIVASVSLGSMFALIGYLFGVSWFAIEVGDDFTRSTGVTSDPNNLAMLIIFVLPFVVFWLAHGRRPLVRLAALVLLAINLGAMVVSFSRSGGLVTALLLATLLVVNARGLRPRHLGLLFAGGAMALLVALLLVPQGYWERQATLTASDTDRSINRRASYLVVAGDAFEQRPLIGHGPGTFRELYAKTDWAQRFDREGATNRRFAHNTYLEVVVGTGVLGLICFLGLLAVAARNLWLARRLLLARGDPYHAAQVLHYLLAFLFLLLYMAMFSDVFQKYMLLSLGVSQLWLRFALSVADEGTG
ncbi:MULTISPECIES: O-antigen ligase family protein [Marichromatium]|uniref:O-antigen ligase n=1 Tax=Marichromatium gracile TaxID=1048 RepID=A0A4R4ACM3_MARGR|nr:MULTISPECIES: O-antigen ligase family protein [Marichromatium]MBK1709049.1 O-antigen polymerase [Marichromatium gracile]RNE91784.1 O-antigen ligase family protein [Marichromatium sp. AB32]TCW36822.1 O-antigen ligase [Marichromatium gracile]